MEETQADIKLAEQQLNSLRETVQQLKSRATLVLMIRFRKHLGMAKILRDRKQIVSTN